MITDEFANSTMGTTDINRRSFLKGSVGVAGALGITSLFGCAPSTPDPAPTPGQISVEDDVQATEGLGTPVEVMDCDVVVVGTGTAGMAAAVQAVERGAKVIVIEKTPMIGGQSMAAEVMFGSNSRIQDKLGLHYTDYELLTHECNFHNWHVDYELWSKVIAISGESINWLLDNVEPYGGGFATVLGGIDAPTVAHMFNSYTDDEGSWEKGAGISHALNKVLLKNGVEVKTKCEAKKLITEGDKVVGLYAESEKGLIQINAKATILACGGFTGSKEMIDSLGRNSSRMMVRGFGTNVGDGINMAREVGADHRGSMCTQLMGPSLPVASAGDYRYANAISVLFGHPLWVNQNGARFVQEAGLIYTVTANAIDMQDDVYSIFDSALIEQYKSIASGPQMATYFTPGTMLDKVQDELDELLGAGADFVFKADSIAELGKKLGLPQGALEQSVQRYNELAAKGIDEDFGKDPALLVPVQTGPFYALRVYTNLLCTGGGVRINEHAQVLRPGSVPIPGLYCAGCDCDGFMGETYGVNIPGSTQGIALCTGRMAALHATENL